MRQDIERQNKLEPKRFAFAKQEIKKLGYEIQFENERYLIISYKNKLVRLFPYSGWHSGETIKDGRGLQNLINQIK